MHVNQLFDLTGKTAVITGAGSGLGQQIALAMAEAGANLALVDINQHANTQTLEQVKAIGAAVESYQCNVASEAEVTALFAAIHNHFPSIDIVFANAGIADTNPGPTHDMALSEWQKVMDVNLNGVFLTCREALKTMLPQQSGKLIITASMWGTRGSAPIIPLPAYTASKGAVINLTREMALEYAAQNIQINAICPGFMRSNLAGGAYDNPEFVSAITQYTPAGRVADAAEIKGLALFLASAGSSFVTGTSFVIDGGVTAR